MPRGVQVPREVRRGFWGGVRAGRTAAEAAVAIGVSSHIGGGGLGGGGGVVGAGGVIPHIDEPTGLRLSLRERESIGLLVAEGVSMRRIADQLGRSVSTVSREIARNGGRQRYRPLRAQLRAEREARRPQVSKLATRVRLRERVEADLRALYSPEQVAGRLRVDYPEDPEMQVHHERTNPERIG